MRPLPKTENDILGDLASAGYEIWDIEPDGICLRSQHGPLILNAKTWERGLVEAHSLVWGTGKQHKAPQWPEEDEILD